MAYVYEATELLMSAHERADDIPLLIAHLGRMGLPALLDKQTPPGGLWGGLSAGWVATLWLAHILSQSEDKQRHVQPWVATHPETLRACLRHDVAPAEVHDLRLRDLLLLLGNDAVWQAFELELNRHLIQTYELEADQVLVQRMENWTWFVQPDGSLHLNQARGWRPGALKLTLLYTALEPLGLPLVTSVASGRFATANAITALIDQTQAAIDRQGVLFLGEQLRELESRAAIHAANGSYLSRVPEADLAADHAGWIGRQAVPLAFGAEGDADQIEGYEWRERVVGSNGGAAWEERRILMRSRAQVETAASELRARLDQARRAVEALNERKRGKRRPRTLPAMHQAVHDILESHQVSGLLTLAYDESVDERTVRRYRGRPTAVRVEREVRVTVAVDEAAVERAVTRLAWQLFVTNLRRTALTPVWLLQSDPAAAPAYERLAGRPVSLTPTVLQRDEQALGLVRLLSIALRALVLLEAAVYRRLASDESDGTYGGERRRVALLAGERLLEAFREIVLIPGRGTRKVMVTPLTPLQRRVLHLLKLDPEIYS
jgi:transposase